MKWFRGPDYDMVNTIKMPVYFPLSFNPCNLLVNWHQEPELTQMEGRVRIELSQKGRFSDLWSNWAWKPVLVAIGLMVFQQLSGINAALFNAVPIFESAGSDLDTLVSAVLLNVDQVRIFV